MHCAFYFQDKTGHGLVHIYPTVNICLYLDFNIYFIKNMASFGASLLKEHVWCVFFSLVFFSRFSNREKPVFSHSKLLHLGGVKRWNVREFYQEMKWGLYRCIRPLGHHVRSLFLFIYTSISGLKFCFNLNWILANLLPCHAYILMWVKLLQERGNRCFAV